LRMEASNGMLGRLSWQGMLSSGLCHLHLLTDTICTQPSITIKITLAILVSTLSSPCGLSVSDLLEGPGWVGFQERLVVGPPVRSAATNATVCGGHPTGRPSTCKSKHDSSFIFNEDGRT
jgi:hypothetical protein